MLYILIVSVIINFILWMNLKDKNEEINHLSRNLKDVLNSNKQIDDEIELIPIYSEKV